MLPTLQIGPLVIQTPGLLLLLGLWLGLSLAEKHVNKHAIAANHIYSFTFLALLTAVVAGRLLHVIRNWGVFSDSPASILSLNPGMLEPFGAILGFTIMLIVFTKRYRYDPWTLLDALAPILAVLMIAVSLANLASGKGYGYPTDLPWAVPLFGEARHPTQIYEMLAAGIVLVVLWPGRRWVKSRPAGVYALSLIAATASNRLIFEAFRADSALTNDGIRSSQVVAWLVLAVALWLSLKIARKDGQDIHR